jgi:hypothetical protein
MTSAIGGFTSEETFPCTVTMGAWARRFLPALLFQLVVLSLLFGFLLGLIRVPIPLNWLVALGVAVIFVVVQWIGKQRQFAETWATARLELSPDGAAVVQRHCRLVLPWDRIRTLGKADLVRVGGSHVVAGGRAGLIAVLLSMATNAITRRPGQDALIGSGSLKVSSSASRIVRVQIAQNQSVRTFEPGTAHQSAAIVLPVYDGDWRNGRIGDWVRAYRPDLLTDRAAAR